MNVFLFMLLTLVTWRITHLLAIEDGPFDIVYKLRKRLGNGFLASLLDCFYCLSIWVAFPLGFGFANKLTMKLLLWMALSGAACLLHKITRKDNYYKPASFHED